MSESPTVLVATDFSEHARHAAERAARVAREMQASLRVLHVLPAGPMQELRNWLGAAGDAESRLRAQADTQLHDLVAQLQGAHGVTVQATLHDGPVLDATLQEAERVDARLIVVGAWGEGHVRRLVLGTTAGRVMRKTTRPVLAVRQPPSAAYRRVLVAVDFSPWSAGAIALARAVAPEAALMLTTVFQVPFEDRLHLAGVDAATIASYREQARADATRRLHETAAEAGLVSSQWEARVVDGDPSHRLVEVEQEAGCDLVVLGKHGTSMAVDLLLGSVTHHMLAEGAADVLISTRQVD